MPAKAKITAKASSTAQQRTLHRYPSLKQASTKNQLSIRATVPQCYRVRKQRTLQTLEQAQVTGHHSCSYMYLVVEGLLFLKQRTIQVLDRQMSQDTVQLKSFCFLKVCM